MKGTFGFDRRPPVLVIVLDLSPQRTPAGFPAA
jgi:hypothetical protein